MALAGRPRDFNSDSPTGSGQALESLQQWCGKYVKPTWLM